MKSNSLLSRTFIGSLALSLSFCLGMTAPVLGQDEPNAQTMIKNLDQFWGLLEKKDHTAASDYLVLPSNFKPEMLNVFIERRELSKEGLMRMEREGKFGKANEIFGEDRATHYADRAKVDADGCYGFILETEEVTGEVMGFWNGTMFKFVRVNNVGQLSPASDTGGTPPVNGPGPATQQQPAPTLAELEAAVAASPEDVGTRALYAQSLFQSGNLPLAWSQLMEAYKLDPSHAGVAQGTGEMIQSFANRDVFTVGIPQDSVQGLLGDPRQKVELGKNRERWVYAHVGVDFKDGRLHELLDLRGITEASFKPTETVSVELDGSGWRCGHRRRNRGNIVAFYYKPGESYGNWTQQITVERVLNGAKVAGSLEKLQELVTQQLLSMNPETKVKVLHEDDDSVIIATMAPNPDGSMTEHKLDHLMLGPTDFHRLSVTVRGEEPSREFQMKWLEISKAAKLKPVEPVKK